eukprot:CFRG3730T1
MMAEEKATQLYGGILYSHQLSCYTPSKASASKGDAREIDDISKTTLGHSNSYQICTEDDAECEAMEEDLDLCVNGANSFSMLTQDVLEFTKSGHPVVNGDGETASISYSAQSQSCTANLQANNESLFSPLRKDDESVVIVRMREEEIDKEDEMIPKTRKTIEEKCREREMTGYIGASESPEVVPETLLMDFDGSPLPVAHDTTLLSEEQSGVIASEMLGRTNSDKLVNMNKRKHDSQLTTNVPIVKTEQSMHDDKENDEPSMVEVRAVNKCLYDIEQALTCPICLSIVQTPVTTTCNHRFCEYCIKTHLKNNQTCPLCKRHVSNRKLRLNDKLVSTIALCKKLAKAIEVDTQKCDPLEDNDPQWRSTQEMSQKMRNDII